MGVATFTEARAIVEAGLVHGSTTAPNGWEDSDAYRVTVLHPPFMEPSPDGLTLLVDKRTGKVSAVGYLAERDRLDAMEWTA